ncbi:MAG: phosphorylcholine transferase LicD [Clostridia bacterium]
MRKINLEEIHHIELDIMLDIDRVCRNNNLKYTIIGGTMIGAVRHKGFIPWDDDIDIAMPRGDYLKFIDLYEKNKNNQYSIFEHSINSEYYYPLIKISDNRTALIEKNYKPINNLGVNLDVFPIDKVNSKRMKEKLRKLSFYHKGLSKCFTNQEKVTPNKIKRIIKAIIFNKDINYYLKMIENIAQEDNDSECDLAGVLVNATGEKDLFPIDFFDEFTNIEFENNKLMVINKYKEFLEHRFGDYMKIPPKEQRIAHQNECYWREERML